MPESLRFLIFVSLIAFFSCKGFTRQENVIKGEKDPNVAIITGAMQTEAYFPLLEGRKVALAGNHTSLIGNTHLADSLLKAGIELKKVFSPEHGFRGQAAAGEHVQSGYDTATGLPIISLYGASRRPNPKDINDIDIILFDMQDVGLRFYTYISTMSYLMEEAARQGKTVIILDRPNPNGHFVDGPILERSLSSFVGLHPVPVVHGLTIGEYALMVNGEGWLGDGLKCDLIVIPVKNYTRDMWYELPVAPSPNLPNMASIIHYPYLCFFEGTQISLGRGTDFPFQVYGHPDLPEELFPFRFKPESRPAAPQPPQLGNMCNGRDLRTSRPDTLQQIARINLEHLIFAYQNFPNKSAFFNNFFDRLAGTASLRQQIIAGKTEQQIRDSWQEGIRLFREQRKPYLLYPDLED